MTVITNAKESKLQLKFSMGLDSNGKEIIKTKTLTGIKTQATDQDVMDVATALVSLQSNPVADIVRVDADELVNA